MAIPPNFYNVADQKLYNEGIFYKPQERYTLPYNQVSFDDENLVEPDGILSASAVNNFNSNGFNSDGFNSNNTSNLGDYRNIDYNPRPYYDATYEDTFGANAKDPLSNFTMTGDPNKFEEFGDPTGATYAEPNTKMSGILNMIPGAGIARFLGNQIGPYIPPNKRAIMENQLSGQGIMVNDIGQIVQGQGDYDTAANVMAGYNTSKMTAKTFDDRLASLGNMSEKGRAKREAAIEAAKADFLAAQGKTKTIYDFQEEEKKKNKKNTIINRYITKKKETKAAKDTQDLVDVEAVKANIKKAETAKAMSDYRQSRPQSEQNYTGGDTNSNPSTPGAQDSFSNKSGMGRTGYFFGGRVGFKNGGLASIL